MHSEDFKFPFHVTMHVALFACVPRRWRSASCPVCFLPSSSIISYCVCEPLASLFLSFPISIFCSHHLLIPQNTINYERQPTLAGFSRSLSNRRRGGQHPNTARPKDRRTHCSVEGHSGRIQERRIHLEWKVVGAIPERRKPGTVSVARAREFLCSTTRRL